MIFITFEQFEKYIKPRARWSNVIPTSDLQISISFLKEYTWTKNALDKLIYVPEVLLKLILDYTATKADLQQILEIRVDDSPLLHFFDIYQLRYFIDEGWDINKLGKYSSPYPSDLGSTPYKSAPLIRACRDLDYHLIKFYLDNGADIKLKDCDGCAALSIIQGLQHVDRSAKLYIIGLLNQYDSTICIDYQCEY